MEDEEPQRVEVLIMTTYMILAESTVFSRVFILLTCLQGVMIINGFTMIKG